MSRYRITETRQMIVDLDLYQRLDGEDDEAAASALAEDLPDREWDTLDRQVEPL